MGAPSGWGFVNTFQEALTRWKRLRAKADTSFVARLIAQRENDNDEAEARGQWDDMKRRFPQEFDRWIRRPVIKRSRRTDKGRG